MWHLVNLLLSAKSVSQATYRQGYLQQDVCILVIKDISSEGCNHPYEEAIVSMLSDFVHKQLCPHTRNHAHAPLLTLEKTLLSVSRVYF